MGRGSRMGLACGTRGRHWEAGAVPISSPQAPGGEGQHSTFRGRKEGRKDWQKKLCQAEQPYLEELPAALSCSTHLQGAGGEVPCSPPCWPQAGGQPLQLQVVHARTAVWWLTGFSPRCCSEEHNRNQQLALMAGNA